MNASDNKRTVLGTPVQPLRFIDLPLDIRRLVYPLTLYQRDPDRYHQRRRHYKAIISDRESPHYLLPSIMNVSTQVRAEAFQAYVQNTILDLADLGNPSLASAFSFLENVDEYIAKYGLDFGLLANVRVARVLNVEIVDTELLPHGDEEAVRAYGLELIPHCTQLRKLVVDVETWRWGEWRTYWSGDDFRPFGFGATRSLCGEHERD